MKADNLIQLIGILLQVLPVCFTAFIGWKAYLDKELKRGEIEARSEVEKEALRAKEAIEIKKAEVELAKANALSAIQVADILTHYQNVKREIEDMRSSTKIKDEAFDHALTKMEELLEELSQNFTQFLINKAK
jgi:hypothetical protein